MTRQGGRARAIVVRVRKVRAREDTVVANGHPFEPPIRKGRPGTSEGQCHRNETADGPAPGGSALQSSVFRSRDQVRVKRCGKSAPLRRRRRRHGKPHRVKGHAALRRLTTSRLVRPEPRRAGRPLEAGSNVGPREMVAAVGRSIREPPSRSWIETTDGTELGLLAASARNRGPLGDQGPTAFLLHAQSWRHERRFHHVFISVHLASTRR